MKKLGIVISLLISATAFGAENKDEHAFMLKYRDASCSISTSSGYAGAQPRNLAIGFMADKTVIAVEVGNDEHLNPRVAAVGKLQVKDQMIFAGRTAMATGAAGEQMFVLHSIEIDIDKNSILYISSREVNDGANKFQDTTIVDCKTKESLALLPLLVKKVYQPNSPDVQHIRLPTKTQFMKHFGVIE